MKAKRLALSSMIFLIIASATLSRAAYSESSNMQMFYSLNYGKLLVEVNGPTQAWPGDNTNITIRAEALANNIHVNFIRLNFTGLKEGLEEMTLLASVTFLENVDLNNGEFSERLYEVTIQEDALPGLIYGTVWYSWDIEGDVPAHFEVPPQAFPATFIENKAYVELKEDYDSLGANYTDLQAKYEQLKGSQNAQGEATGLMYVFLITTGIFVVTTILLLVRRPEASNY